MKYNIINQELDLTGQMFLLQKVYMKKNIVNSHMGKVGMINKNKNSDICEVPLTSE